MARVIISIFLSLAVVIQHDPSNVFLVESWHQTAGPIREARIVVQLSCTNENAFVTRTIAGQDQEESYTLRIKPAEAQRRTCGEKGTLGWMVFLFEKDKESYRNNLLRPTRDEAQDYYTAEDVLGLFVVGTEHGATEGAAGLFQSRAVKIGDFYCVMSAADVRYVDNSRQAMSSIELEIVFTNDHPA